jgi:hypothetical protein
MVFAQQMFKAKSTFAGMMVDLFAFAALAAALLLRDHPAATVASVHGGVIEPACQAALGLAV